MSDTTTTTTETLTTAQILALRAEALAHGDAAQAYICDVALGRSNEADAPDGPMARSGARAECARVIAAAEAAAKD